MSGASGASRQPTLPCTCRWAVCGLLVAVFALPASGATAQGRRPGLGGRYADRRITIARNVNSTVAGPWSNAMLGVRRNVPGEARGLRAGLDGGVELVRPGGGAGPPGSRAPDLVLALNAGVTFGLSDEIEGGALFVSFDFLPDFGYRSPFFVTWARSFGDVDVGARIVGQIGGGDPTIIDSAFVLLARLGTSRVDAAVMVPVVFDGDTRATAGLKVPLRYGLNPIPELVLGLESGVVEPDFSRARDVAIPLGGYLGTSWLVRAVVLDVGVSFQWDEFLRPRPRDGVDALGVRFWRASLGLTVHQRVL